MKPLEQVRAQDQTALAMENDLLRYEIRHLRGRLDAQRKQIEAEAGRKPGATSPPQPGASAGTVDAAVERERRTRNDLVWLLRRLEGSPLRWFYSRRPGFVALRDRYLGES